LNRKFTIFFDRTQNSVDTASAVSFKGRQSGKTPWTPLDKGIFNPEGTTRANPLLGLELFLQQYFTFFHHFR